MAKSTISKLFVGGVVAALAGAIACIVAVIGLFANGTFVVNGSVVGINWAGFTAPLIVTGVLGCLAVFGGFVAGLIAWIGALFNTVQLDDKTWFVLLLVLGLLSFGFFAMVAYVIAGPDGTLTARRVDRSSPLAANV